MVHSIDDFILKHDYNNTCIHVYMLQNKQASSPLKVHTTTQPPPQAQIKNLKKKKI
jgi:hypothetical protein